MKTLTLLSAATALLLLNGCSTTDVAPPAQYGTIGDKVWNDANANGQQDAGEAPIAGVKVVLYDGAGSLKLDSTTTSSAGAYLYDKLIAGNYKLRFVAPAGMVSTLTGTGSGLTNSDADKLGWTRTVTIDVSKNLTDTLHVNTALDAGFRPQTSYAKDVNPILVANCAFCHSETSGAAFAARVKHVNNYANAKGIGAAILDRVSRAQGAAGMMPRNGTRLSEDKIAVIRRWVEDGLGE
ncbi:SdrD B-like domain-containing protein [Fibrella aquatilis]|uniref:Cytochrome c domain-containing protein n=1 Tax=Fibrella aquatilis TaxID=2817059 RepID=A0A939G8Y9_9BACT|nr:SdrD B-like domain-containing protein [Fibrella aquatilis]MBO0934036.1 hypothetical protein [Fibrella aquatilis]